MTLHVTHEALSLLQESDAWKSWPYAISNRLTPEDAYGPKGRISFIWGTEFKDAEDLECALCTNMGGGVPHQIIRSLVEICVSLELKE
ncbi:MAG: hypothetical protein WCH42_07250 [Actinomycetes bacterium]